MIEFFQHLNWVIVGEIILIDILLGGDNAIVIALLATALTACGEKAAETATRAAADAAAGVKPCSSTCFTTRSRPSGVNRAFLCTFIEGSLG